ncbi:MAG: hypothetical protein AAFY02_20635 [Pseudomonadota bacterium]
MFEALLFAGPGVADEGTPRSVPHEGLERVFWTVDGRSEKDEAAPLVLALHGFRKPEEAEDLRQQPQDLGWSRLEDLARAEGFVAVFPAAYRGRWSLVPGMKNATHEDGRPIDDVGFLLHLVRQMVDAGAADPQRLYITGISDGAIMTHRLICLSDTPFAAAATLIGTAHEDHIGDCEPDPPPALMQVHGDNDHILPYDGWIFRIGREVSVPEVMDHWRRLHGCTGQGGERLDDIDPDDGSTVVRLDWTGCAGEPNVKLYKIKGGGHRVPALDAEQSEDPKWRVNRDLDTLGEAWRFFSAARRLTE